MRYSKNGLQCCPQNSNFPQLLLKALSPRQPIPCLDFLQDPPIQFFQKIIFQDTTFASIYLSIIHLFYLQQQRNTLKQKMSNSSYSIDSTSSVVHKRPYRKLPQEERKDLIRQVFQNRLSISKAAQKLGINNSTAKVVVRKYRQDLKKRQELKNKENVSEGRNQIEYSQAPISFPFYFYYPQFEPQPVYMNLYAAGPHYFTL